MTRRRLPFLLALVLPFLGHAARAEDESAEILPGWTRTSSARARDLERALNSVPSTERLAQWHEAFCAEPHPAGTPGEQRLAAKMLAAFEEMGLETVRHDVWAWLPRHGRAYIEVFDGRKRIPVELGERKVARDPSVAQRVPPAWNAYSGTGAVTAGVVYANYGTKEDFERLDELGVSCKGRIVIARYGRNYRGYKAKYAEARGAAGAILYTDPDDSGYRRGLPYPEGGFANETSVQRGSIKTLDYPGDPLTPFRPATEKAERLDPKDVALPKIPVQPVGWKAASEILARMRGAEVPQGWQGGLPFRYRLTGGDGLQVRLEVEQPRAITKTANVLAMVRGRTLPDEWVVVGCHLDAWTFGAGDPHAGSIVLFEMARSFAWAARQGHRPERTVVFANWGAEEFGIIGSTEWCEAHGEQLAAGGIAYVNLDMAAMGPDFRTAAAPLLKRVVEEATREVPQARGDGASVHAAWTARGKGTPSFGNLGGGSDHVGFYCHLGVPSCSLGGGGSRGVSYHSAYDTLAWYRQVVGDYEPALMLARVGNVLVSRLANAPLLPYDIARPLADARAHIDAMFGTQAGGKRATDPLRARLARMETKARAVQEDLHGAVASGRCAGARLQRANAALRALERVWLLEDGLPGRPWYRHAFATSDPWSGYAAWMLPLLRAAHEATDGAALAAAVGTYGAVLDRIEHQLAVLLAAAGGD